MVNQATPDPSPIALKSAQHQQLEQSRMTDVLLILENLFIREESTVKQVLDCLYDIGSVNLIDQRVQSRWLNRLAKWIAHFSKPVFQVIALRWIKRNCPRLVTHWLYTQVKFEPHQIARVVEAAEEAGDQPIPSPKPIPPAPTASVWSELDLYRQEVRQLHSRVKLLTSLLIGVTVTLGSGLAWSLWRDRGQTAQIAQPTSIELADRIQSCNFQVPQPCQ